MNKSPKKPLLILVLVVFLGYAGWKIYNQQMNSSFAYAGTLEATRIELPSRVSTVIESIEVNEGDKVTKGQRLATLACEDLKITAQHIGDEYRRANRLKSSQAISQEVYDSANAKKLEYHTRL